LDIKNEKDAKNASEKYLLLKQEIQEIDEQNQFTKKQEEAKKLSQSLSTWLYRQKMDEFSSTSGTVRLVERRRSFWVWDKKEIPKELKVKNVTPLSKFFREYFGEDFIRVRNIVTKRVVDTDALDDFIRGIKFKSEKQKDKFLKELSKANIEYIDTRYIQKAKDAE